MPAFGGVNQAGLVCICVNLGSGNYPSEKYSSSVEREKEEEESEMVKGKCYGHKIACE